MKSKSHVPGRRAAGSAWRHFALLPVCMVALLAACGDKGGAKPPSQTAAKVNKEEITVHQINHLLQQQRGLKPEQADAASRQILERLIDQELGLQQAGELKVDRDPRVMQQIDVARREVVFRAFAEKVGDGVPKPTAEEIAKYYQSKPALFSERRIYNLQEMAIEAKPEQFAELRAKLEAAKSTSDFVDYLKSQGIRFAGNQAVRAAEQLPLANVDAIARMKDGQAVINQTPTGAQVVVLSGSRSQPVSLESAKPAIEQFLLNERRREAIAAELKRLRAAAHVEYVGKFAAPAASAAADTPTATPAAAAAVPASVATPSSETAARPAAPSASGLDAATISKGLGIK